MSSMPRRVQLLFSLVDRCLETGSPFLGGVSVTAVHCASSWITGLLGLAREFIGSRFNRMYLQVILVVC